MTGRSWLAVAVIAPASVACSGWPGHALDFEEVTYEIRECSGGEPEVHDCLVIEGTVIGSGHGTGSCTVYAAGNDRNITAAATSPEWELEPGRTVTWEVAVERPDAEDFRGWNPVCDPMAEG